MFNESCDTQLNDIAVVGSELQLFDLVRGARRRRLGRHRQARHRLARGGQSILMVLLTVLLHVNSLRN